MIDDRDLVPPPPMEDEPGIRYGLTWRETVAIASGLLLFGAITGLGVLLLSPLTRACT